MCCTDGCACGIPAKTINDIAKELAELQPPIELENQQNQVTPKQKRGMSNDIQRTK
jgi:hypothetical protein